MLTGIDAPSLPGRRFIAERRAGKGEWVGKGVADERAGFEVYSMPYYTTNSRCR